MKSLFFCILAIAISAQADNYEREGTYEAGSCSERKSREQADSVFESGVPIIGRVGGRRFQVGCCRSTVVAACGQSFQEIANAIRSNINSEDWAVCMKAVAIQRATNQTGELPEMASSCKALSCRAWADDCRDAGLERVRSAIGEELPHPESQY